MGKELEFNFQNLLEQTENAFNKSKIKKYAEQNNKKWFYSLFGSKPLHGSILILGINFGASDEDYQAQTINGINSLKYFSDMDIDDLGKSFLRLKNFITNYNLINIKKIVWTNYCFFRSYGREDLNIIKQDFNLTNEIFLELLEIIKPIYIICLSKDVEYDLKCNNLLTNEQSKTIKGINSKSDYTVVKGKLNNIDFYCLPHPNFPAISQKRMESWDFCFKN